MSTRIVHDLEAIEVEITQHVLAFATMAAFGRLFQAALELAAVHESREGIMSGLIGHLTRKPAQFGHIVQQQRSADDFLRVVANG